MRKTGNGDHVSVEKFLEDIKAVVQDGQELLKVGATQAKRRAVLGAQVTEKQVREHPYQSIGIVFGLGILVGVLASSLMGRSHEDYEEAEM
jgi:ElaB/YqjD/DUF883 family membrane-anchored ribosome-binding protein